MEFHLSLQVAEDYNYDITSKPDLSIERRIHLRLDPLVLYPLRVLRKKMIDMELGRDLELYFFADGKKTYWGKDTKPCWNQNKIRKLYVVDRIITTHSVLEYYDPLAKFVREKGITIESLKNLTAKTISEIALDILPQYYDLAKSFFLVNTIKEKLDIFLYVPERVLAIGAYSGYLIPISSAAQIAYKLARLVINTVDVHNFYDAANAVQTKVDEYHEKCERYLQDFKKKVVDKIEHEKKLLETIEKYIETGAITIVDGKINIDLSVSEEIKELGITYAEFYRYLKNKFKLK